jgi:hypothetical protein
MPSGLGALDLVDVAAGWAGLGWFPGEAWMELHEGAVNAALGELTSTQVGRRGGGVLMGHCRWRWMWMGPGSCY